MSSSSPSFAISSNDASFVLRDQLLPLTQWRLRVVKFSDGERYPLLLHQGGEPDWNTTLFITTQVRNAASAPNTSVAVLSAIRVLLAWSEARQFDLEERFRKQQFLTLSEIESLRDFAQTTVRTRFNTLPAAVKASPGITFSRTLESARAKHSISRNFVKNQTLHLRLSYIARYLKWLAIQFTDGCKAETALQVRSRISTMTQQIRELRPRCPSSLPNSAKKGLSPATLSHLLRLVDATSEENPFELLVRTRNELIISLLRSLGIRSGELLALKVTDLDFQRNEVIIPRRHGEAHTNLAEFIRVCREELTVFGKDLDWNNDVWKPAGVSFGNLDQRVRRFKPENAMHSPFKEFAKAYFRYDQGVKPTKQMAEIPTLKCVERALVESHGPVAVSSITHAVLDRAAVLASTFFSKKLAHQIGRELSALASFLSEKRLISRRLDWQSPLKCPHTGVRTGAKAREERNKKLPSDEALHKLASIFSANPSGARDMFTTSIVAMLLCAPSRISEILALPEDCEVWETKSDGTKAFGWRMRASKGAPPLIKWIPGPMVEIAQESVRRIRSISAEARRIADWCEHHPDRFYRHAMCPNVDENEGLSAHQTAQALGLVSIDLRGERILIGQLGLSTKYGANSLASLNRWIHARLPKHFPWVDEDRTLRFSEALFCFRRHEFRRGYTTLPYLFWIPTHHVVNTDLSPTGNMSFMTIFDRHGMNRPGQSPLSLTTHQLRHLLNTMAQRGGMSQDEIAYWSGRIDVRQNREYDHMSEFELVELLRKNTSSLSLDRPLAEIAKRLSEIIPMTPQEFNTLVHPTAHITKYGFCIHNFVMSPCPRFSDCLNCSEQVCIKGDRRIDELRAHYRIVKALKERAEQEIADGTAGADRWYEIQVLTEMRIAELIAILEDPSIEDGAIVRLRNQFEFSPIRRALETRFPATVQQVQQPFTAKLQPTS